MALDRILNIEYNLDVEYLDEVFNGDEYYKDTIGVTVMNEQQLLEIHLKIDRHNAPYVITKPFHHSQRILEKLDDGSVIVYIKVHHNYELERLLLGFGESIEVIKPRILRQRMKYKLKKALGYYSKNTK